MIANAYGDYTYRTYSVFVVQVSVFSWVILEGFETHIQTDITLPLLHLPAACAQPYSQHQPPDGGQQLSDPAANHPQYLTSCQPCCLAQNTHTLTDSQLLYLSHKEADNFLSLPAHLPFKLDIFSISNAKMVYQSYADKLSVDKLLLLFFLQ